MRFRLTTQINRAGPSMVQAFAELSSAEKAWRVVSRTQQLRGEERANFLRLLAIVVFYGIELINRHGFHIGALQLPAIEGVDAAFHRQITALTAAWLVPAIGVFLCLQSRWMPAALKYLSTGIDIVLLTSVLTVADGPRSPLVAGYFLIIALSGLRFDLPLIRCATVGCMVTWLYVNGFATWFSSRDTAVPRYHQLIVLVALALTGVIVGQIVRGVRRAVLEQSARRTEPAT